jgi:hypothetical protein
MLIAGHNSIQMSLRYVHPDFALVVGAMENFADRLDTENSVKILTNASPVDDRPVVKN